MSCRDCSTNLHVLLQYNSVSFFGIVVTGADLVGYHPNVVDMKGTFHRFFCFFFFGGGGTTTLEKPPCRTYYS